ncbi:MAG: DUF4238 domain-containing protein [Candidatus Poribacteria bacterium]|nr:DUF4238 domain-containing protein [Candidatus Poribacteria bacterium]
MGHHYVPRFYLKNFAYNTDRSQVYSMTTEGKILDEPNAVGDICQKKNYNTPQQEQEQGLFEEKHAHVLREFIETSNPETFYNLHTFIELISFMMGNNIHIRTVMNQWLRKKLCDYMIREGFPADINFDTNLVDTGYRGQLNNSIGFAGCVLNEFKNWKFVRYLSLEKKRVFITSDNPVNMLNPGNMFTPGKITLEYKNLRVNIGDDRPVSKGRVAIDYELDFTFDSVSFGRDAIMVFPVTPYMYVLGFSDGERYTKYMDRPQGKKDNIISTINLVMHNQCNRAVYSCSKDELEVTKINKPRFLDYCQRHGYVPSFDAAIC